MSYSALQNCPLALSGSISTSRVTGTRVRYLLGLIIEAHGGEDASFTLADTPAEEPRVFQQFLKVVQPPPGLPAVPPTEL